MDSAPEASKTRKTSSVDVAVALQAVAPDEIPRLAGDIASLGASPPEDDTARLELLKKARSLVQALETPRETMIRHLWAEVSRPSSRL